MWTDVTWNLDCRLRVSLRYRKRTKLARHVTSLWGALELQMSYFALECAILRFKGLYILERLKVSIPRICQTPVILASPIPVRYTLNATKFMSILTLFLLSCNGHSTHLELCLLLLLLHPFSLLGRFLNFCKWWKKRKKEFISHEY